MAQPDGYITSFFCDLLESDNCSELLIEFLARGQRCKTTIPALTTRLLFRPQLFTSGGFGSLSAAAVHLV